MQIPFIILSYGEFSQSKKLFSYERDGLHTLPVFTDANRAMDFAIAMTRILNEDLGDHRVLRTQMCTDPKAALSMFETITAYCPDLLRIVIDPYPPIRDNAETMTDLSTLRWVENFQDIDDVLEQLQDWLAVDLAVEDEAPASKDQNDSLSS